MPDTTGGQEVQVWRAPASLWIFSAVSLAGQAIFVVWIGSQLVGDDDLLAALIGPLAFVVLDLRLWFRVFRPCTLAGPDGVTIRSGRRTTHLAWTEIGRCDAGFSGITITCLNGARALAPWPQKSNIAGWTGRTTKADKIAAYLQFRANCYREGIILNADFPETSQ